MKCLQVKKKFTVILLLNGITRRNCSVLAVDQNAAALKAFAAYPKGRVVLDEIREMAR